MLALDVCLLSPNKRRCKGSQVRSRLSSGEGLTTLRPRLGFPCQQVKDTSTVVLLCSQGSVSETARSVSLDLTQIIFWSFITKGQFSRGPTHSSLSLMDVLWMIVLTVGLLGSHCEGAISCKNEIGGDVDWFILYKKPAGFDYVYIDSTDQNLKKNNKPVNNQAGVLAHTLNPYFERSSDSGFIAYNDQPPNEESVNCKHGHSKGVVMMDKDNVVWLLHSTPKFPKGDKSNNFYPKSGERNAQIFMCVTLKSAQSAQIAQHLKGINAYIFDKHNPEKLRDSSTAPQPPYHEDLLSAGGQQFKRFVKKISTKSEGDLYVTIADTLKSDLYIQTWHSKPETMDTTTDGHKLYNIKPPFGCDHSKWCVSDSENWMCVGDSNRQPSQFKRPGGALCINSKPVADAFREIKSSTDKDSATNCDTDSATNCDPDSDTRPSPSKRLRVGKTV
ncbi:deoxyribonuclease-2-beta-like isoform X1 [Oreochromis niloticus]|uniref:deoxyribonuclease-2-beta-like isoform X1 n=1 Tax=Oreochromis niloticus TaxID=8128 RepID=UPI000904858B|nr:deoxyribonuclease-2-beta-like isoform X1 [Oreochromis niloticus]